MVYADDILLSDSDSTGITDTKAHLHKHFVTKYLGQPRYFLWIEVARSTKLIILSQRKYDINLLGETWLTGTKPADTPVESNSGIWREDDSEVEDKSKYRRLVRKLIYLIVTRSDI